MNESNPGQTLEDACRRDYGLGYLFGQGRIGVQRVYYSLLHPEYADKWGQAALNALAETYKTNHKAMISSMSAGHKPHVIQKFTSRAYEELAQRWADFSYFALRGKGMASTVAWRCNTVARFMIAADIEMMQKGRFAEKFNDIHASLFRDYVLLGESTESATSDTTLLGIKSQVQASGLMDGHEAARLEYIWSLYHLKEQFYPVADR